MLLFAVLLYLGLTLRVVSGREAVLVLCELENDGFSPQVRQMSDIC